MAHTQLDGRPPFKAASAMGAYLPITFLQGGSALSETVRLAATAIELQFGLTMATVASAGDPVQFWPPGDVAKGIAGASMGAGAPVAVGSTNGVLAPMLPSGLSTSLGSALGAGPPRWAVGYVLKNAAAGDLIPVFIAPQQII